MKHLLYSFLILATTLVSAQSFPFIPNVGQVTDTSGNQNTTIDYMQRSSGSDAFFDEYGFYTTYIKGEIDSQIDTLKRVDVTFD